MARPSSEQISLGDTPYYHIVSRCVRRAFLCGEDRESGQSYEHRRQWVEDRIRLLASLFAVDIAGMPETSEHASIKERVEAAFDVRAAKATRNHTHPDRHRSA